MNRFLYMLLLGLGFCTLAHAQFKVTMPALQVYVREGKVSLPNVPIMLVSGKDTLHRVSSEYGHVDYFESLEDSVTLIVRHRGYQAYQKVIKRIPVPNQVTIADVFLKREEQNE